MDLILCILCVKKQLYFTQKNTYIDLMIPRLRASDVDRAFRYLAKQPSAIRQQILKEQTSLLRRHRSSQTGKLTVADYELALASAALKFREEERRLMRKSNMTADEADKLRDIRIARAKAQKKEKSANKRALVEHRYFELIGKLRKEELSWRQISDYLRSNHRQKISHSYIQKTWTELQNRNEEG